MIKTYKINSKRSTVMIFFFSKINFEKKKGKYFLK